MGIKAAAGFLLLVMSLGLTASVFSGCQTNTHSQGLMEEKRSGGVSDPYIVRDPAAQNRPQNASPTTQPANQAPAR